MIAEVFNRTADALNRVAKRLHITYNEINIIVYYMVVPLTWMLMLDFIIHCWPWLTAIWIAICLIVCWWHRNDFRQWCDWAFDKSADFLEQFHFLGWDYTKASVVICVVLPLLIYAALFWLLL